MATLTIKNLPDEIYARLTKTAKRNRRSLNGEAIVTLEQGLQFAQPDLATTLERVRRNRATLKEKGVWLTDKIIDQAKNEGRP